MSGGSAVSRPAATVQVVRAWLLSLPLRPPAARRVSLAETRVAADNVSSRLELGKAGRLTRGHPYILYTLVRPSFRRRVAHHCQFSRPNALSTRVHLGDNALRVCCTVSPADQTLHCVLTVPFFSPTLHQEQGQSILSRTPSFRHHSDRSRPARIPPATRSFTNCPGALC